MDITRMDLGSVTPGVEYVGAACVRRRQDRSTRNGKPYLIIKLGNRTGDCIARVWSESIEEWDGISAGSAVHLRARGKASFDDGAPELEIVDVQQLDDSHPIRLELNPSAPMSAEELQRRLEYTVRLIRRPQARTLVRLVLEAVGRDRFMTAPAAVGHHHAYTGGLAQHSLEVARIALAIAKAGDFSPLVDHDLLIAGALLHDVGKAGDARGGEYAWEGTPIAVSRLGQLRSHVAWGAEIVAEATREAISKGEVNPTEVLHLQHVIESHHGIREWGSPTAPRTLEAQVVHLADNASAKLAALSNDLSSTEPDDDYWVEPVGWRRTAIWNVAAQLAADDDLLATDADGHDSSDRMVRGSNGPPPVSVLDSDDDWNPPVLELSQPMTRYLVWLVNRDLEDWTASRRARMSRDEAVALQAFLADFLGEPTRTRSADEEGLPVRLAAI